MYRHEPRRRGTARIREETSRRPGRTETVLALIGECGAVVSCPCAAGVAADIATRPTEGCNRWRRRLYRHPEISRSGRTDRGQCEQRNASLHKLFHDVSPDE